MATETVRLVAISTTFCVRPLFFKKRLVKTHPEKDLDKWRGDIAMLSLESERTSDGRPCVAAADLSVRCLKSGEGGNRPKIRELVACGGGR